ncbi:MAG: NUDIX hydrolase [Planctomycetota bacterium]|jgi:ADP-ribose pyrophosphatase YjhB (NUDIX family)
MKNVTRKAVRAVILTPEGSILLMRAQEPVSGRQVWFTPGGGREPGESPEACLGRELAEEIGPFARAIGPPIWVRTHTFDWGDRRITQNETYHLVRSDRFTPLSTGNPDPVEASAFREFRWWTAAEIAGSNDLFAPRQLARFLARLIEFGPPDVLVDTGV